MTRFPTGREGGGASHQRGGISLARQGSCMVLAAKGGIKNGAKGAVPSQRSGTSYLPRAEPSTRPGGVSRSRTEPLAPRAKGPAAPSTLARESGRQPSGILESTAQVPTPHPLYIAIEKFHRFPFDPFRFSKFFPFQGISAFFEISCRRT